jgi:hypothetical protein
MSPTTRDYTTFAGHLTEVTVRANDVTGLIPNYLTLFITAALSIPGEYKGVAVSLPVTSDMTGLAPFG